MTTFLKKLSPAAVCKDSLRRLDVPNAPKEVPLYDVYGAAVRTKSGVTDKGEWLRFHGQFEAVVCETGEVFQAPACFLPQPFQDDLQYQLGVVQQSDPNGSVEFAVRVSIVPPAKGKPSATGYEYRCQPLIDGERESPLKKLRALVSERAKALTAGEGAKASPE